MPTFCAMMPDLMDFFLIGSRLSRSRRSRLPNSELDLDVNAGRKVEAHQRIDRLRRRIDDIEDAFMGADLELLARLLVDMGRAVDGEALELGRQRNGAADLGAGALCRRHDLTGRRIENPMVERLEAYANVLTVH